MRNGPWCAGASYYGDYYDVCYVVGRPDITNIKLMTSRAFGYGLTLPDMSLWIAGGLADYIEVNSTEIIRGNEKATRGPDLPVSVGYHCMTLVDDSTAMLIGGYIKEDSEYTGRTFFYSFQTQRWDEGPSMTHRRGYLGCGSFQSQFHGDSLVTVAMGGWDGGRHIYDDSELLVHDFDCASWMEGPVMPQNLFQMSTMTNTKQNGLLVVGGYSKGIGEMSTLYELTCPSSGCQWSLLDQKLQVPRCKHVAFLIYDTVFDCDKRQNGTILE